MLTEGKSFSRKDLLDPKAAALISRLASQTLSGPEFKKFTDKLPKESTKYAVNGLKEALSGLTIESEDGLTGASLSAVQKTNQETRGKAETIVNQIIKLDTKKIRDLSRDLVPVDRIDGTRGLDFSDKPASEDRVAKNARSLDVKQLGTMTSEELEKIGQYFSAGTIIKADSSEHINSSQSEAIQRGVIINFKQGDQNMEATIKTVAANRLIGNDFKVMVKDALEEVKELDEKDTKRKNVEAANVYLKSLESKDETKEKKRQAGFASKDIE